MPQINEQRLEKKRVAAKKTRDKERDEKERKNCALQRKKQKSAARVRTYRLKESSTNNANNMDPPTDPMATPPSNRRSTASTPVSSSLVSASVQQQRTDLNLSAMNALQVGFGDYSTAFKHSCDNLAAMTTEYKAGFELYQAKVSIIRSEGLASLSGIQDGLASPPPELPDFMPQPSPLKIVERVPMKVDEPAQVKVADAAIAPLKVDEAANLKVDEYFPIFYWDKGAKADAMRKRMEPLKLPPAFVGASTGFPADWKPPVAGIYVFGKRIVNELKPVVFGAGSAGDVFCATANDQVASQKIGSTKRENSSQNISPSKKKRAPPGSLETVTEEQEEEEAPLTMPSFKRRRTNDYKY